MAMAMRSSTAQVTTVNERIHQAMLLRISGNMRYLLGDIQRLIQLLHKLSTYSKGFKRWRMIEVGIAGNIVRWVDSFLSDRRAMLVIDGRTGETRSMQAGLP